MAESSPSDPEARALVITHIFRRRGVGYSVVEQGWRCEVVHERTAAKNGDGRQVKDDPMAAAIPAPAAWAMLAAPLYLRT